jgi:undecaprenyl diphosphate synthase
MDREKMMREGVRMRFIGDLDLLPEDLRDECNRLERDSRDNSEFVANFCVAYGGRQELVEAVRKIVDKKINSNEIDGEVIAENLYLSSEPDFIIRTGGEKRTSNFLPWQASYSEWFFLDKMWPEFEKEDLVKCVEEFRGRKRNFGG